MRYGRVILASMVLLGFGYAASAFHPDVYHVVREHVSPPETRIGAAMNLGWMGAALGMFLSLGLAPAAWLDSEAGRWWREVGGGRIPLRVEMLGLAALLLFVTAVLADHAFLNR